MQEDDNHPGTIEEDKAQSRKQRSLSDQVAQKIKNSASQIWLAGLGAYAKAEQEGNKLFETLVKDGEHIETLTKEQIDKQWNQCKDKVEGVKERATHSWEKIEKAFDERVSHALARLGIPTRSEVEALKAELIRLNDEIMAIKSGMKK